MGYLLQSNLCSDSDLKELYHEIIKYESSVLNGSKDLPCFVSIEKSSYSDLCILEKVDYGLKIEEIETIARNVNGKNLSHCINKLLERGFLIRVEDREGLYRSFHVDTLLRVSDIRVKPAGGKMVLQTRMMIGEHFIDDFSQARLLPRGDGEREERELYNLLGELLGEDFKNIFIEVITEYLKYRGAQGFTYFQIRAIKEVISAFKNKYTYLIASPAGSGKTEIFMAIILFKILYDLKNGRKGRVIVAYPRKFLEVDQSERLIELVRILNETLKKRGLGTPYKIAIRDGDTEKIEREVAASERNGRDMVEFRGIRCAGKSKLMVKIGHKERYVVCDDKKYDFVGWSREDAKHADIIVTNLYTVFFRSVAKSDKDLDVSDLLGNKPLDMVILDEVHEYQPAELGLFYYTLKTLNYIRKERTRLEPIRLVLSSATIANPEELIKSISDEEGILLNYAEVIKKEMARVKELEKAGKIGLTSKLVVLGIVVINPIYSWETYTSQLAITLSFLSHVQRIVFNDNKQAVIFLNNVRELNRIHTIINNDLQLGSPLDNAGLLDVEATESLDPLKFRYSIKHYGDILKNSAERSSKVKEFLDMVRTNKQIKDVIYDRLAKVFSDTPLDERMVLSEKIRSKEVYTILATSSLELGVDYPGVTIVVNIAFDERLSSIIQRFGRAGRRLSETLNTTLAILVIRNNPLEYLKLLEGIKRKTLASLVKGFLDIKEIENLNTSLTRDISVIVGRDLEAVKKLGILRSLLILKTFQKTSMHGLSTISNPTDECRILASLREDVEKFREDLSKLYGEKQVEIIKESVLGFRSIEECREFQKLELDIHKCVDFLEDLCEKTIEFIELLERLESAAREHGYSKGIRVIKTVRDSLKDVRTNLAEAIKILGEVEDSGTKILQYFKELRITAILSKLEKSINNKELRNVISKLIELSDNYEHQSAINSCNSMRIEVWKKLGENTCKVLEEKLGGLR